MTEPENPRTIEQILDLRLHAAALRVLERNLALVKGLSRTSIRPVSSERRAELETEQRLAVEDLALVQREVDAQKGLRTAPVEFSPATTFALNRYAAVLMSNNPGMDPVEAIAQAHQDEQTRFNDWFERYGPDIEDDDDQ